MRFDCGETWQEEVARLSQWRDFFTLVPRRIKAHDCRWLETIQRKGSIHGNVGDGFWWEWEYRAKR